jgi:2'-5' RNA ligase
MIRAFVAIRPPDAVCEALEELQADLDVGRAVAFENLHLTLAFLGAHPAPVIADFVDNLAAIRAGGFDLTLSGVGAFGDARPRSAHAIVAPNPGLSALRNKIARKAELAGLGDNRRFTPHITLARFAGGEGRGLELRDWLTLHAGFRLGPFHVGEFALYRSTLTRSGPVYTDMARFPL